MKYILKNLVFKYYHFVKKMNFVLKFNDLVQFKDMKAMKLGVYMNITSKL